MEIMIVDHVSNIVSLIPFKSFLQYVQALREKAMSDMFCLCLREQSIVLVTQCHYN